MKFIAIVLAVILCVIASTLAADDEGSPIIISGNTIGKILSWHPKLIQAQL